MNRVVLIDGVEGSGKTFLINKMKKEYPNWKFIKCPAESIIKRFFNSMMSKDFKMCSEYVSALIDDIRQTFKLYDNETLVFDRGMLSTLVYQGRNRKLVNMINNKYSNLFKTLGVDFMESCIVLMCEEVEGKTREDKSDCPEKNELAKVEDKEKLFRRFAYDENQPFPVYEFSWNKKKPNWIDVNDIMSEVLELL